jgi:hypothetical protein
MSSSALTVLRGRTTNPFAVCFYASLCRPLSRTRYVMVKSCPCVYPLGFHKICKESLVFPPYWFKMANILHEAETESYKGSGKWINDCMLRSSAIERRVVSEPTIRRIYTSIFRVENQLSKKPARSRCLGTPEDGNIHNYRCDNLKYYKWFEAQASAGNVNYIIISLLYL